uniref:Uncharacterized protein n=1 Tax=Oryza rufipogon TaxID=4529 RepID=A0A0E0NKB3_ORYRU
MEINRLNSTKTNLPVIKSDGQTKKDMNLQNLENIKRRTKMAQSRLVSDSESLKNANLQNNETMKKEQSGTTVTQGADRTKSQVTGNRTEELRRKKTVEGSHYLQDFEKCKKSGTIGSEMCENKAQLLYDQYTFLNENERLGGQMSYTNLMQQIIQSPRVSLQANENSMILATSRFSPQESHQHDRLYEEQISTEHWSYEEFDRLYNNSNMVTWTEVLCYQFKNMRLNVQVFQMVIQGWPKSG